MDMQRIERWFCTVMERLDRQELLLEEIRQRQQVMPPVEERNDVSADRDKWYNGERLYDNQDLCMMLQVSKRSLQRYRSIGILPYLMLRQKTYYKETDVEKFLSEHLDEFKKDQIAAYKARIR
ncbi:MAG: helix-turn-helix domain-containing protein [Paraprevotella sp.]|nr:helix-turn-helix domain-containing protein [Paraprevotella sp.]